MAKPANRVGTSVGTVYRNNYFYYLINHLVEKIGGEGGIRTHGTLSRTPVFKTGAFDHSATPPAKGDLATLAAIVKRLRGNSAEAHARTFHDNGHSLDCARAEDRTHSNGRRTADDARQALKQGWAWAERICAGKAGSGRRSCLHLR